MIKLVIKNNHMEGEIVILKDHKTGSLLINMKLLFVTCFNGAYKTRSVITGGHCLKVVFSIKLTV